MSQWTQQCARRQCGCHARTVAETSGLGLSGLHGQLHMGALSRGETHPSDRARGCKARTSPRRRRHRTGRPRCQQRAREQCQWATGSWSTWLCVALGCQAKGNTRTTCSASPRAMLLTSCMQSFDRGTIGYGGGVSTRGILHMVHDEVLESRGEGGRILEPTFHRRCSACLAVCAAAIHRQLAGFSGVSIHCRCQARRFALPPQ